MEHIKLNKASNPSIDSWCWLVNLSCFIRHQSTEWVLTAAATWLSQNYLGSTVTPKVFSRGKMRRCLNNKKNNVFLSLLSLKSVEFLIKQHKRAGYIKWM